MSASLPSLLEHLIWRVKFLFGSTKWRVNVALGLEGDSHRHDRVNFSQPKVNVSSNGFIGSNVDVIESSGIVKDEAFVLSFQ
jgi:hypothetical protein